jgi:hypothetical protein
MPVYRLVPSGDLALSGDATATTGITSISAGGSLVVVSGLAQIRQRIAARLKFFMGEWFLDLRQGMPYYRDVLVANPNFPLIRSLFRRAILTTPGVLSLPRLLLSFDAPARQLTVSFQAVCTDGKIEVEPGDDDFLLDLPVAA